MDPDKRLRPGKREIDRIVDGLEVANSNVLLVRLFISPIGDDQSIARDCFHPSSIRKGIF